ncbi:hypothetical protein [Pseudomonas brassicacearum]|jgi:hypothetical protein|uniref:hypothetical protein n=1 Tax=Pseudomonas brassicacearum TaxID=930166 RepID=UPI0011CDECCC|nr:hypothetical protein [Pseudomonas brassicacearum]
MASPVIDFLHKFEGGIVNCGSFRGEGQARGLEVYVGSLGGVQVGAVLKLDFEGYNPADGDNPIPESKTSLNHFLTSEDIENGVRLIIATWDRHVKYVRTGSVRATGTINGGSLVTVLSRASFVLPDGSSCFPT